MAMKVIKVLEHGHTYKERLSEQGLVILEERQPGEVLSVLINT